MLLKGGTHDVFVVEFRGQYHLHELCILSHELRIP